MGQKHANASCIVVHIGLKSKTGTKTNVHPSHFTKHKIWTVLFCWMQIWFRCFFDIYERTFDILQCYTQQRTIKRKTPNKKQKTIRKRGYDPPNQKNIIISTELSHCFGGISRLLELHHLHHRWLWLRYRCGALGWWGEKNTWIWPAIFMWCFFSAVMVSHTNICNILTKVVMNLNLVSGSLANLFFGSSLFWTPNQACLIHASKNFKWFSAVFG